MWKGLSFSKLSDQKYSYEHRIQGIKAKPKRIKVSQSIACCLQNLREITEPCSIRWMLIKWTIWKLKKFKKTNLHNQMTIAIPSRYKSEGITRVLRQHLLDWDRTCYIFVFTIEWAVTGQSHSKQELSYLSIWSPSSMLLLHIKQATNPKQI